MTKADALREAVLGLLREHDRDGALPTSVRFLVYELRGRGYPDSTRPRGSTRSGGKRRGFDQDVSDACTWLRERGLVPWDWLADETRTVVAYRYAESVGDYLVGSLRAARLNPWDGPPPLIVCESRGFAGVLARSLADEYLCAVTGTGGQVGGFLRTAVAPLLRGNRRPVLYVGDLDLSGHMIEANTRRVLVEEAGERPWRRVALTEEQAVGLPRVVKVDGRFTPPREHEAVEVEALGQREVTALVRDALDALLPAPLAVTREREERERERWRRVIAEERRAT